MPGIAPFPLRDVPAEPPPISASSSPREGRAVDCRGVRFLDAFDRASLHKQALDRIERRQIVMARLQRPHLRRDAEQLAEEILDMRRQLDQQIQFPGVPKGLGIAPRRHQPVMQRAIRRREIRDESPIDAHETVAVVEVGEGEREWQRQIGHRKWASGSGGSGDPRASMCR